MTVSGRHLTTSTLVLLAGMSFACTPRGSKTEASGKAKVAESAADVPDKTRKEVSPEPEFLPPPGSAAYFLYSSGVYRLDSEGWTPVFGPADRLLRGGDGAIYVVDRVGVHRLAGETHVPVHVVDNDGASKALFGAIEHVEVGPRGELWELLRREHRWIVERIDPGGAVARWDEPSVMSSSDPLELVVDGDGRAWFVPEAADAPLSHKQPQSDWATISAWQREGEAYEALAAASDGQAGLWILTEVELVHVDADAKVIRIPLPERGLWQTADLAINEVGEAVVRDAACFLDLYSLSSPAVGAKSLGQYRGYACSEEPMVFALDSQQRTWLRTSERDVSVWTPEGSEVELEGPQDVGDRKDIGELIAVVVVGAGPTIETN